MLVDKLSFYSMFNAQISVYMGQLQDIMTFGGSVTKGSVMNSAILLQSWDAKDEIRTCKYESNIALTVLLMGRRSLTMILGRDVWLEALALTTAFIYMYWAKSHCKYTDRCEKCAFFMLFIHIFFYILPNVFIYFANRIDETNSYTCILDDLHGYNVLTPSSHTTV